MAKPSTYRAPERIHIKPRTPETIVRDPRSRAALPAAGAWVPDSSYYRRRLRSGDVEFVEPAPDTQKKTKTAPTKKAEE